MLRPKTSPCRRLHLHTTEPRCEHSRMPSQLWESTWHAYSATLSLESHPTERGNGTTRVLGSRGLVSSPSGHVIEVNSQSQHGRIHDSTLLPALFVPLFVNGIVRSENISKWTSSLSYPFIFILTQEDFRHAERYKMPPCSEYITFCSKQEHLGISDHVGRQHNPGWKCNLRTFSTISSCAHDHRNLHFDDCHSLHPGMWRIIGEPFQCIGSVKVLAHDRYVKRSAHGYPKTSSNI
jgi:hypothetical protein